VLGKEHKKEIPVDVSSAVVERHHPVCIAVMHHRTCSPALFYHFAHVPEVLFERFRWPAKITKGIAGQAYRMCSCRFQQRGCEHGTSTVSAIDDNGKAGIDGDLIEDCLFVGGECIESGFIPLMTPVCPVQFLKPVFNLLLLCLQKRGAVWVEQFDPIVLLGVVRCGDHAAGLCRAGAVGDRRRGSNPGKACLSAGLKDTGDYCPGKQRACGPGIGSHDTVRKMFPDNCTNSKCRVHQIPAKLLPDPGRTKKHASGLAFYIKRVLAPATGRCPACTPVPVSRTGTSVPCPGAG